MGVIKVIYIDVIDGCCTLQVQCFVIQNTVKAFFRHYTKLLFRKEADSRGECRYSSFRLVLALEANTQHPWRNPCNYLLIFTLSNDELLCWVIDIDVPRERRRKEEIRIALVLEHYRIPVDVLLNFPCHKIRFLSSDFLTWFGLHVDVCRKVILVLDHHEAQVVVEIDVRPFFWICWDW